MKDYFKFFIQTNSAPEWGWIIKNRIAPWVKKQGGDEYWDLVNTVSQQRGVLKENLTRLEFAELMISMFPGLFKEGKTKDQLKWNMDKCPMGIL